MRNNHGSSSHGQPVRPNRSSLEGRQASGLDDSFDSVTSAGSDSTASDGLPVTPLNGARSPDDQISRSGKSHATTATQRTTPPSAISSVSATSNTPSTSRTHHVSSLPSPAPIVAPSPTQTRRVREFFAPYDSSRGNEADVDEGEAAPVRPHRRLSYGNHDDDDEETHRRSFQQNGGPASSVEIPPHPYPRSAQGVSRGMGAGSRTHRIVSSTSTLPPPPVGDQKSHSASSTPETRKKISVATDKPHSSGPPMPAASDSRRHRSDPTDVFNNSIGGDASLNATMRQRPSFFKRNDQQRNSSSRRSSSLGGSNSSNRFGHRMSLSLSAKEVDKKMGSDTDLALTSSGSGADRSSSESSPERESGSSGTKSEAGGGPGGRARRKYFQQQQQRTVLPGRAMRQLLPSGEYMSSGMGLPMSRPLSPSERSTNSELDFIGSQSWGTSLSLWTLRRVRLNTRTLFLVGLGVIFVMTASLSVVSNMILIRPDDNLISATDETGKQGKTVVATLGIPPPRRTNDRSQAGAQPVINGLRFGGHRPTNRHNGAGSVASFEKGNRPRHFDKAKTPTKDTKHGNYAHHAKKTAAKKGHTALRFAFPLGSLEPENSAFGDLDIRMYRDSNRVDEGDSRSVRPRLLSLDGSSVKEVTSSHTPVEIYPADFSDNTQYYSIFDSSDERLSRMERRLPYADGDCVPMKEWQTTFHPSCNGMHELALEHLGQEEHAHLFGTKGYWRNAWRMDLVGEGENFEQKDPFVLKTLKYEHNFEDAHFEHDRIDAVAMERLTSSPHVINIHGFCGHSVLTEYADGPRLGTLADKAKKKPLERLKIARDIASGLADVHGIDGDGNATFVHLDINPANVVSVGGTLKLNDFNIGIILRWNQRRNRHCGFPAQYPNPQWRSPEEAQNSQHLTEKVDVFSMGHIFFRMICGHEPWNKLEPGGKPTKDEVNEKVKKGKLPFIPKEVTKSEDPEVVAIRTAMLKCYATDPKKRPTARSIANDLQKALSKLEK